MHIPNASRRLGSRGSSPWSVRLLSLLDGALLRAAAPLLLRLRNRHLMLWDLLVLPVAVVLAFALRLDAILPAAQRDTILLYALLAPLVKLPLCLSLGLYQRYWRFASLSEMRLIGACALAGSAVLGLFVLAFLVPMGTLGIVPRSIPLLDLLLAGLVLALPRYLIRAASWRAGGRHKRPAEGDPKRVLIVGAGDAGHHTLEEIVANPQLGLLPVGLVDDDLTKHGLRLHDCRVLGGRDDIADLVRELRVDRVILALPSASGKTLREILAVCQTARVETMTLPGMTDLLSGSVGVDRIRRVQIEDLLRREPVATDVAGVRELLRGRTVLVTGAGGSIGSELCRQIARCAPDALVLLGHGENSLFRIGNELRAAYPDLSLHAVVADIRDRPRLEAVFATHRPAVVFHAAAHKHVPLMEDNIADALSNNVLGTRNLAEVAADSGVGHLVMISTDKAVNPTSVMGATKRLAELVVQDVAHRTGRCFVAVRFGNVLGSRGSVVPLFQEQIARGGPVTVTHPDMRRYFMTIPEAVQLVLQAGTLGRGGEVFFLDMGEPVRIVDLARDLIALSGLEEGRDIDITFTGLRPGEKLFEELAFDGESYVRSAHEKVFICRQAQPATHPEADARARFFRRLDALLAAAPVGAPADLRARIRQLVPEYAPPTAALARAPSRAAGPSAVTRPAGDTALPRPAAVPGS